MNSVEYMLKGGIILEKDWLLGLVDDMQIQLIEKSNNVSEKFGLVINEDDAKLLVAKRKDILKEQNRIEFGESIPPKIIFAFCDSPFIDQNNYIDTLMRLQEMFYYYKNETNDEVTDDELIECMKEAFDGICQGSLEYLEETVLDEFARRR